MCEVAAVAWEPSRVNKCQIVDTVNMPLIEGTVKTSQPPIQSLLGFTALMVLCWVYIYMVHEDHSNIYHQFVIRILKTS